MCQVVKTKNGEWFCIPPYASTNYLEVKMRRLGISKSQVECMISFDSKGKRIAMFQFVKTREV